MKTYCINLESRPDRWRKVQKEAAKLNLTLTRVDAIRDMVPHMGCRQTHLNILRFPDPVFMVIEDDMKVLQPFDVLERAISQLPEDWDMLYLGATLRKPLERYSENLYRLKGGAATHAIIYNNQHGICEYIVENHDTVAVDIFYAKNVQEHFNCYMTYPMVATQCPGYSDILGHWTSYRGIQKNYKKFT